MSNTEAEQCTSKLPKASSTGLPSGLCGSQSPALSRLLLFFPFSSYGAHGGHGPEALVCLSSCGEYLRKSLIDMGGNLVESISFKPYFQYSVTSFLSHRRANFPENSARNLPRLLITPCPSTEEYLSLGTFHIHLWKSLYCVARGWL